jgi:hypothetical protein
MKIDDIKIIEKVDITEKKKMTENIEKILLKTIKN